MSETCPVLTLAQIKTPLAGDAARELDVRTKTGLPIRLVDLRIVNEESRDVAHHGKSQSPGESWCGRRG
jgi:fatty-acyl-CoA synthase